MKILKYIDRGLAWVSIGFIRIYQLTLSPDKGLPSLRLKGKICAHEPHCSEYGRRTFARYGFWKGIFKVADRIVHCRPSHCKQYDPEHYRVVFFSSAAIGIPFLEKLQIDKRFEIVGVVTTPDKPIGRGMKVQESIVKKAAKKIFSDVIPAQARILGSLKSLSSQEGHVVDKNSIQTPNKIRSKSEEGKQFINRLKEKRADYFVVIAYGKIIPQEILNIPQIAPINIHGSLLPEYRGASPIQSVLLNKRKTTGITIMKMDAGLDTGNMIDKLKFHIKFDRTAKNIIHKMQSVGPKFLVDTLRKYGKQMLGEVEQDNSKAIHCGKIEKESGQINPRKDTLEDIYAKYRGYFLWPKVYFFLDEKFGSHNGKRIVVEDLLLDEDLFRKYKSNPLLKDKELNPAIKNIILKPEGKKKQNWEAFLSGYGR